VCVGAEGEGEVRFLGKNVVFTYLKQMTAVFSKLYHVGDLKKGKGHPCTGTEALCRPYGP